MRIAVPYGQEYIPVEVPAPRLAQVVTANDVEVGDPAKTIDNALRQPLNAPPFDAFMAGGGHLLVIVNDATRPTPTAAVLSHIRSRL
ncbi:DUF2088 domain-containing protein, partial [bacterium]|nr:DUF2088 domain-containing protein [candidate division CSSED10-310 bacterium]